MGRARALANVRTPQRVYLSWEPMEEEFKDDCVDAIRKKLKSYRLSDEAMESPHTGLAGTLRQAVDWNAYLNTDAPITDVICCISGEYIEGNRDADRGEMLRLLQLKLQSGEQMEIPTVWIAIVESLEVALLTLGADMELGESPQSELLHFLHGEPPSGKPFELENTVERDRQINESLTQRLMNRERSRSAFRLGGDGETTNETPRRRGGLFGFFRRSG